MRTRLIASLCAGLLGLAAAFAQPAGDGRSIETAVVVESAAGSQGAIAIEREWLRRHYPGARVVGQALLSSQNGRRYDRLDIVLPSGEGRSIFFDITAAFGLPR